MATAPVFAVTPRIGIGALSAANTALDGTGTIVDVITGGTNGTKISEVVIQATGNTTAGAVRLFLYDGTNTRLVDDITVAAATVSATVRATRSSNLYQNLTLPNSNWKLRAATYNANTINVIAYGADL